MSNYLSQLARASGLGYEPRPRQTPAPPGAGATRGGEAATHEPPHFEQIVFVEPTPRAARRREPAGREGGEPTGGRRERAGDDARAWRLEEAGGFTSEARAAADAPHGAAGRAQGFSPGEDVCPPPRPGEGRIRLSGPGPSEREASAHDESPPAEDPAVPSGERAETSGAQLENRPRAARTRPTRDQAQGRTPAPEDETVLVSPRGEADAPGVGLRPARAEPDGPRRLESQNKEEARRAFLREVIEWVSAPREAKAEERGGAYEGEGHFEGGRRQAGLNVSDGASAAPAGAGAEAGRGPEVEDFTLSIGSIHVIVEEPPGQTAAPPAPPPPSPSTGRSAGSSDDGGSRLRRHYIRV